jgi:hypothetical protein
MSRSTRILAVGIATLLFLLLLGGGFFLYWPTCLATPCYDLTVTAVTFPAPGKFRIEYEDRIVYGWGFSRRYDVGDAKGTHGEATGDFWSFDDHRVLRWPRTSRGLYMEYEATMEEGPPGTPADEAMMRSRILVKPGAYRIHPGETLVFYRGGAGKGKPLQGIIEMRPDVQDDTPMEYKPDTPR